MKLIFGLGNPGERYRNTRHNIGRRVVFELGERLGAKSWREKFGGTFTEVGLPGSFAGPFGAAGEPLILAAPDTYMNASGECVVAFAGYMKVPPDAMLVVVDDVNLPLGTLRMRRSGSDGGHKGLRSVAAGIGSEDYARLRLGVGVPQGVELVEYVLSDFSEEESKIAAESVKRAGDAVLTWAGHGCEVAMNRFNG
ncbi:MAG: aminoacyl-tRNA hydrolase [Planctomycetota bacterium]|nr:aminoacyl-tRNA hydrolase [Planctomycetota bacterium]